MWHVIQRGSAYGVRSPSGRDHYTDRHGRPYSKRTATREARRYARLDAGETRPARCPTCHRSTAPTAILPCTCPADAEPGGCHA